MVATESFPAQSFAYWAGVMNNSWVLGDFIWTAIDYIGESAIGSNGANTPALDACGGYCTAPWPYHVSFCGDLDLVGLPKPQSFYRRVLWNVSKLEMAVHAPVAAGQHEVIGGWGWPDERQAYGPWEVTPTAPLQVRVFATYPAVQLYLNNRTVGNVVNMSAANEFTAIYQVDYIPGVLHAVALDNGRVVASKTLTTAGKPASLRLTPDRASITAFRKDLCYVLVELLDAAGVLVPTPSYTTMLVASGNGELYAAGTGNPLDPSLTVGASAKNTYNGQVMALLRPTLPFSTGVIQLTASVPALDLHATISVPLTKL